MRWIWGPAGILLGAIAVCGAPLAQTPSPNPFEIPEPTSGDDSLPPRGLPDPEEKQVQVDPADLVIMGRIYTGQADRPRASLLAIRGDRILYIGELADLETEPPPAWMGRKTRLLRASKGAVLPGFNDAHAHLTQGLGLQIDLDLSGVASIEALLSQVQSYGNRQRSDSRVLGSEWNPLLIQGSFEPTRQMLDEVLPDRPVILFTEGSHAAWLNTAALESLNLMNATASLPGTVIFQDSEDLPTGFMVGDDLTYRLRQLCMPTDRDATEWIAAGISKANRFGITSVQEPVSIALHTYLTRIHDRGMLTVRFHIQNDGSPRLADREAVARGHWITYESDEDAARRHSIQELASLRGDQPPTHRTSPIGYLERLRTFGLRTAFHVPGNATSPQLQGFLFSRPAIERLAAAKAVVRVTPAFLAKDLGRPRFYEQMYGEELSTLVLPLRTMLDKGITLAFGSEFGQNPLDPYVGLYSACVRRPPNSPFIAPWHPEQGITVEESIRAYTLGPALAEGSSEVKGTLEVGKLADIVILARDPYSLDGEVFPKPEVTHTIVGGKVVFRSSD